MVVPVAHKSIIVASVASSTSSISAVTLTRLKKTTRTIFRQIPGLIVAALTLQLLQNQRQTFNNSFDRSGKSYQPLFRIWQSVTRIKFLDTSNSSLAVLFNFLYHATSFADHST